MTLGNMRANGVRWLAPRENLRPKPHRNALVRYSHPARYLGMGENRAG